MEGSDVVASSNSSIALVQGRFVVFVTPAESLTADLDQRLFANTSRGGDISISAAGDETKILVPNPYGAGDIRITIEVGGPVVADENALSPADRSTGPISQASAPASRVPPDPWSVQDTVIESPWLTERRPSPPIGPPVVVGIEPRKRPPPPSRTKASGSVSVSDRTETTGASAASPSSTRTEIVSAPP